MSDNIRRNGRSILGKADVQLQFGRNEQRKMRDVDATRSRRRNLAFGEREHRTFNAERTRERDHVIP